MTHVVIHIHSHNLVACAHLCSPVQAVTMNERSDLEDATGIWKRHKQDFAGDGVLGPRDEGGTYPAWARGWYKAVVRKQGPIWTAPYMFSSGGAGARVI